MLFSSPVFDTATLNVINGNNRTNNNNTGPVTFPPFVANWENKNVLIFQVFEALLSYNVLTKMC